MFTKYCTFDFHTCSVHHFNSEDLGEFVRPFADELLKLQVCNSADDLPILEINIQVTDFVRLFEAILRDVGNVFSFIIIDE